MAISGMLVGGLLIAFVGWLRHWRGVNETISSLLMVYIAIGVFNYLVEGPMKRPSERANKPSTLEIDEKYWVGKLLPPEQGSSLPKEENRPPRPKRASMPLAKTQVAYGTMSRMYSGKSIGVSAWESFSAWHPTCSCITRRSVSRQAWSAAMFAPPRLRVCRSAGSSSSPVRLRAPRPVSRAWWKSPPANIAPTPP